MRQRKLLLPKPVFHVFSRNRTLIFSWTMNEEYVYLCGLQQDRNMFWPIIYTRMPMYHLASSMSLSYIITGECLFHLLETLCPFLCPVSSNWKWWLEQELLSRARAAGLAETRSPSRAALPGLPTPDLRENRALPKALAFCISAAPSRDHPNCKRFDVGFTEMDHYPENVKTIPLQREKKPLMKIQDNMQTLIK